ncbi:hypothetical protein CH252_07350 [Rhodococcus sp. 06-1477-1B]|nr:hypothetical protein CH252_07350 [Rhodococcus sp. 06-1477-1B]
MVASPRRLTASLALAAVIAAGLAVHAFAPAGDLGDIAGDALYAAATYLAVVLVAPRAARRVVAAIAATWCIAVELFQATGIPRELAAHVTPLALVLGTGFDPRDLVVYVLAVAAVCGLDHAVRPGGPFRSERRSGGSSRTPRRGG